MNQRKMKCQRPTWGLTLNFYRSRGSAHEAVPPKRRTTSKRKKDRGIRDLSISDEQKGGSKENGPHEPEPPGIMVSNFLYQMAAS